MVVLSTVMGRFGLCASFFICHIDIIVSPVDAFPCTLNPLLGNSTVKPCVISKPTTAIPDEHDPTDGTFLTSPYIFVVLCTLVFVPFLIMLKIWWVRRLQKTQYSRSRRGTQRPEPDICVIDPAFCAPPPSYEECIAQPPAYKDLKFGQDDKPCENEGTSTGTSLQLNAV